MLMSDTFSAALDNQTKNRGSPGEWFAHTADYRESPRQRRVRPEAQRIATKNQPHMSTAALAGYAERSRNKPDDEDQTEWRPTDFDSEMCPRVRLRTSEAEVIARKSIQTDKWHDFEGNLEYAPPVRPYRLGAGEDGQGTIDILHMKEINQATQKEPYGCPSKEAQWNSRWSTKGSDVAACLGGLTKGKLQVVDSNEDTNETLGRSTALRMRSAKVRGSDAEQWQTRGYQGSMALSGEIYSGLLTFKSVATKPKLIGRIRPEAQEFQEKSTSGSQLLNCLRITESSREGMPDDLQYNSLLPSRLRSEEAELAMQRNRGQMDQYLGKQANSVTQPCGRKVHPRAIRSDEGYETVLKSTGANARELLTHDTLPPEGVHSGFARLTKEARETAQRNQQGLIGNLLGGKDQSNVPLVGVEAPVPQRLHYEAIEYAVRNRGNEMRSLIEQSL
ncbi:uncharacterized protein DEA37_0005997 [Paragonimus westermani]|uniref:Uncharacterized protein n=1 Tax=Paragonimus westermani TaxID=34504 RepID=A0A5J4P2Q1_9TREM|nr:uncharacterized protein DEA37_0005997 [Paragonimus westermani]